MKQFKTILILVVVSIFTNSCLNNKSNAHAIADTEEIPDCKIMIIVGDDRSGSSQSIQKLNKEDYTKIIDVINANGNGYFASTILGNPAPNSKEIFRLKVRALKDYENILKTDNPTLTEQAKQKKHNEKIKAKNDKIKAKNAQRLQTFLSSTLEKSVFGYKPHNGKDITNIDLAFDHINKLLKEPNIDDYDSIIVALFTDGVNEPSKSGKIVEIKNKLQLPDNASLYLVGWKDTSVFSGLEVNQFEGKEGFFSYLEDFDCL